MHVSEVFEDRKSFILKNITISQNEFGNDIVTCDRCAHNADEKLVDRVNFEMFKKLRTFLTKNNITNKHELTFSYRGLQEGPNGYQFHDCFVCLKENDKYLEKKPVEHSDEELTKFILSQKISDKPITPEILKTLLKKQVDKMKGLITDETALFIVAKGLGFKVK